MATGGALGRLNVILGLDSTEFTSGLSKADYQAKQRLDSIAKNAKIAGAAIGAAFVAAAAATALAVKKSIDNMDDMSKLAQSTGVAIESLTALGYAGDLAGVPIETLGANMVKLTKNMSDAAKGTGDAKDAFAAMGVSVTDANGKLKSSDDMLGELADKFSSYKDGAEKTALAVAIFGRSGAQMVPMLNAGSEGLKQATDEAQRFGQVISQEAATAAENFNDNISRLQLIQEGWVNQLAASVLPQLNNFIQLLVDGASSSDDLKSGIDDLTRSTAMPEWIDAVGVGLSRLIDVSIALAKTISAVSGSFKSVLADSEVAVKALKALPTQPWNWFSDDASKELDDALARRNKTVADANQAYSDLWNVPLNTFEQGWIKSREKTAFDRAFIGPMPQSASVLAPIITRPEKPTKPNAPKNEDPLGVFIKDQNIDYAMGEYQRYLDFVDEITGRTARQQIEQQREWLSDALRLGNITYTEYEKAMDQLAKKSQDTMSQIDEFTLQAARNIQDSLGDGLYDLLTGKFDDIAKSWGDMITRMVAQAAAAQLGRYLFGDFGNTNQIGGLLGSVGSFASGLFGDGSVSIGPAFTFSANGNVFPSSPDLSALSGGIYNRPTAFRFAKGAGILGEAGSEAVMPLKRGPDGKLGVASQGGGGVTIIMNNNGTPQQIEGEPKVSRDQMGRAVIELMINDVRTNGKFTRTLKGAMT